MQDSIQTEKEEQECADELDEEIRALTKQASEKTYIGGLTKECVDAFCEHGLSVRRPNDEDRVQL